MGRAQAPPYPLSPLVAGQTDGFLLGSLAGPCTAGPWGTWSPSIPQCSQPQLSHCPGAIRHAPAYPGRRVGEALWQLAGFPWPAHLSEDGEGGEWGGSCLTTLCTPFLSSPDRGASRPPAATCPTPGPAPAATTWQPWPPHPLLVGTIALCFPQSQGRGQSEIATRRVGGFSYQ